VNRTKYSISQIQCTPCMRWGTEVIASFQGKDTAKVFVYFSESRGCCGSRHGTLEKYPTLRRRDLRRTKFVTALLDAYEYEFRHSNGKGGPTGAFFAYVPNNPAARRALEAFNKANVHGQVWVLNEAVVEANAPWVLVARITNEPYCDRDDYYDEEEDDDY